MNEHAEEAAFLWGVRCEAAKSPLYTLEELGEIDERLEAHLQGLLLGGQEVWSILNELFDLDTAGEVFVAGYCYFQSAAAGDIEKLNRHVLENETLAEGISGALMWHEYRVAAPYIASYCQSEHAILKWIGLDAAAIHRVDIKPLLPALLNDGNALVRARALRVVGEFGLAEYLGQCRQALADSDQGVRWAAARSSVLLGDRGAVPILKVLGESPGPYQQDAAELVLRCLPLAEARQWIATLSSSEPENRLLAAHLCGVLGDAGLVGPLIKMMDVPEFSQVAFQSFLRITGIDPDHHNLMLLNPELENQAEEDADPPGYVPDFERVRAWWTDNANRYPPDVRRIYGEQFCKAVVVSALSEADQYLRSGMADELVLNKASRQLLAITDKAMRQKQRLQTG